ncbi:MAG: HAMP domain-containing histidine kinase [Lachnospiraceae bacterium]|nr:HAMP domain-containing histidine kinase [Lachnospiraceae bacterium]
MCIIAVLILLLVSGVAVFLARRNNDRIVNLYKIEVNRVEHELRDHTGGPDFVPDLSKYETVTKAEALTDDNADSFYDSDSNYYIADVDGKLWRIEYSIDLSRERRTLFMAVNIVIAVIFASVILFLVYVYFALIKNFNKISDYPKELSKGNLTIPLAEEKSKYFGQFLWGLDMLREKLESEKSKTLELEKEKNVFLLSLSHDMKTPISAIKLYAAALKKNLYRDEEKIHDVADKLNENAEEIEGYVARIISASGDDFLDLNVRDGEFYLSEAINTIREYYSDKLKTVGTEFSIDDYSDILVRGDRDRFTEVLQNILENAIKYGDGDYIKVSFADEEDARLITVANSGCELPESETEHIFDSFYRGSNVGSKPGSGLGLYIAKKLMHKMGGEIFSETEEGEMRITLVLHKII